MNAHKKEWLTTMDLQDEYAFPKSSQAKWRMKKLIPFIKVGKSIRYKRQDIELWLEQHRIGSELSP